MADHLAIVELLVALPEDAHTPADGSLALRHALPCKESSQQLRPCTQGISCLRACASLAGQPCQRASALNPCFAGIAGLSATTLTGRLTSMQSSRVAMWERQDTCRCAGAECKHSAGCKARLQQRHGP